MSNSRQKSWSDNPNAPKISYHLYFQEKTWLAGNLVSSILYGIVIVLFFKSIAALFDPVHRRGEPIKRGLVSYTVVMFLLVTVGTGMQLDVQSISYIDNRGFPGVEGVIPPGPVGYQELIQPEPIDFVQNIVFALSNWLADGFLLYRCYVVYSMNLWVIAFPCLMFLGSLAMGITFVYQAAQVSSTVWSTLPYFTISLSLNVLLTLMIIIRLILHTRNTRTAVGITGIGALCKAVIIILVESCALYAVNSLLVVGLTGVRNSTWSLFAAIIAQTQVIAPLLIILRVANRSALTKNTITLGRISEVKFGVQGGLTGGSGGDLTSSASEHGTNSGELRVGVRTTDTDSHQDEI